MERFRTLAGRGVHVLAIRAQLVEAVFSASLEALTTSLPICADVALKGQCHFMKLICYDGRLQLCGEGGDKVA